MGDRANIHVQEEGHEGVYLYSHWGGSGLPVHLQNALNRGRDRWDDGQYLARIIFCQMVGTDMTGTSGLGITSSVWDNGYPIIEVDPDNQTVSIDDRSWSFEEFIAIDSDRVNIWTGEPMEE